MIRKLYGQMLWSVFAFSIIASPIAAQSLLKRTLELERLQGYWEGKGAGGDCSIIITGNSLQYRAGTTGYEATFVLSGKSDPLQLQAIIQKSGPTEDSIGETVYVAYRLRDSILILTTYDPGDEPPETFSENNLYVLKKTDFLGLPLN